MFSIKTWVYLSCAVATILVLAPPSSAEVINCSSDDMHRHYCAIETRGGVRLVKQRSDASCRQGRSWGYDRGGIWVDRGCRADFEVTEWHNDYQQGGQVITCSSDDGHRHLCPTDINGDVRLVQQRSGSPCEQGRSWGFDQRGIWVDHGCRADFQIQARRDRDHYGDHDHDGDHRGDSGQDQILNCSSDDMHRHYCAVDTRGGVQLFKKHSDAECRQGYSWGFDRGGIWVDHGCRADFQIVR